MYYKNYNPSLHDVYLYPPSNIGFPVSLNPNCVLYGASASYSGLSIRYRVGYTAAANSNVSGVTLTPPPGTTEAYLTNYYNIPQTPLFHVVSPKILSTSAHYSANHTSAALSAGGLGVALCNWTGTTGTYSPPTMMFWNLNYTGFSTIPGPWEVMYNMVPYDQIAGVCGGFSYSRYFATSPEIPLPEGAGNTFWLIMLPDNAFMDNGNPGVTMNQSILKTISPGVVFNDNKNSGSSYYIKIVEGGNGTEEPYVTCLVVWKPQNVYFWDGCDRAIPVDYCSYSFPLNYEPLPGGAITTSSITASWNVSGWPDSPVLHNGDSSGKILYLKDNKLFLMGQVRVSSGDFIKDPETGEVVKVAGGSNGTPGNLYLARYYHLEPHMNPLDFWQAGSTGLTLALQYHFDPIYSQIQQNISALENLLESFTG